MILNSASWMPWKFSFYNLWCNFLFHRLFWCLRLFCGGKDVVESIWQCSLYLGVMWFFSRNYQVILDLRTLGLSKFVLFTISFLTCSALWSANALFISKHKLWCEVSKSLIAHWIFCGPCHTLDRTFKSFSVTDDSLLFLLFIHINKQWHKNGCQHFSK